MAITVEAVYEGGVLKPVEPLSMLREGEKVTLTVTVEPKGTTAGAIDWKGRHEEFRALLEDPEERDGGPGFWFADHPLGPDGFRLKPPEEKS